MMLSQPCLMCGARPLTLSKRKFSPVHRPRPRSSTQMTGGHLHLIVRTVQNKARTWFFSGLCRTIGWTCLQVRAWFVLPLPKGGCFGSGDSRRRTRGTKVFAMIKSRPESKLCLLMLRLRQSTAASLENLVRSRDGAVYSVCGAMPGARRKRDYVVTAGKVDAVRRLRSVNPTCG